MTRKWHYNGAMSVAWNQESIEKLTEKLYDHLDKMEDEDLAYLVEILHYDDWLHYAEDPAFGSLVSALAILGMSSFALIRSGKC